MPETYTSFRPGQTWLDTQGKPIQAHGGGVLYERGTYYWYGEDKDGPTHAGSSPGSLHHVDVIGVHCYSSRDLYNWQDEGIVLPAQPAHSAHDLHPSKVVERPKVIYCPSTRRYVMWLHIDTADYCTARTGVAASERPQGPFNYLGSFRPDGAESRDMTLFQDEDGAAYLVHSSEGNATLHVSRLAADGLNTSGSFTRAFAGGYREAPAVFKRRGRYYLITSGCTGWDPNPAMVAAAESPLGDWKALGNPCIGRGAEITFQAQSAFVLPVAGRRDAFILMTDLWNKGDLRASRYAWLPIRFRRGKPVIEWLDEWDLSIFN